MLPTEGAVALLRRWSLLALLRRHHWWQVKKWEGNRREKCKKIGVGKHDYAMTEKSIEYLFMLALVNSKIKFNSRPIDSNN